MIDLPIYPWPNTALPEIRAAKAHTSLPIAKPRAATQQDTRILATMLPPKVHDSYYLVRGDDPADLKRGLEWALGFGEDERASGYVDWFSAVMGREVREVAA